MNKDILLFTLLFSCFISLMGAFLLFKCRGVQSRKPLQGSFKSRNVDMQVLYGRIAKALRKLRDKKLTFSKTTFFCRSRKKVFFGN